MCVGAKYKYKIATSILIHSHKQEVTRNQALLGNNMRGSNDLALSPFFAFKPRGHRVGRNAREKGLTRVKLKRDFLIN